MVIFAPTPLYYGSPTPSSVEVTQDRNNTGAATRLSIHSKNTTFNAPFAPRKVTYSGYEGVWNEVARPGRKPILTRAGLNMRKMSMELFVGSSDPYRSVDIELKKLTALAEDPDLITVEYDPRCWGNWRISSLSIDSEQRHPDTSEITRAMVSIEFTEADDKGIDRSASVIAPADRPLTYTVRSGETLLMIANQMYGDPDKWIKIADVNGIKDPKMLVDGSRIRLP
jgi:nucleoid-associated protein YgaU